MIASRCADQGLGQPEQHGDVKEQAGVNDCQPHEVGEIGDDVVAKVRVAEGLAQGGHERNAGRFAAAVAALVDEEGRDEHEQEGDACQYADCNLDGAHAAFQTQAGLEDIGQQRGLGGDDDAEGVGDGNPGREIKALGGGVSEFGQQGEIGSDVGGQEGVEQGLYDHQPDDVPDADFAGGRNEHQEAEQRRRKRARQHEGDAPSAFVAGAVAEGGNQRVGDGIHQTPGGGNQRDHVENAKKNHLGNQEGNAGVIGRDVKVDQHQPNDVDQGRPAQLTDGVSHLASEGELLGRRLKGGGGHGGCSLF
jgi:hypothetical protein